MRGQDKRNSILSMAMLTKPVSEEGFKSTVPVTQKYIFSAAYVNFIHLAGIDVYPILLSATREEVREILLKVNGVMFPGGMSSVIHPDPKDPSRQVLTQYSQMVKVIMEEAKTLNDKDDYFPVFGICLGFEAMVLVESDDVNIIEKKHTGLHYNASLIYAMDPQESKFFSSFPSSLLDYMARVGCTYSYHEYMVDYEKLKADPKVSAIYNVASLSESQDRSCTYVSTIEGKKYPFYAVQYHPELSVISYFPPEFTYPDFNKASEVGRAFMWLMLQEVKKSLHRMDEEGEKKLLANDPGTVLPGAMFGNLYHLWD
eukprot:TRINITY_DN3088_c0_g1_i1.p1 TRINITY_DN3088_c0_g1~~TRINITY_DN3088_c0_g1_i1.p1  ORF type:complete len:314 (-),score=55.79 TRINITY_DN3088_c0_g1_i1:93-1034(-)